MQGMQSHFHLHDFKSTVKLNELRTIFWQEDNFRENSITSAKGTDISAAKAEQGTLHYS